MRLWMVMFFVMLGIVASGLYLQGSILKTTDHLSHTLDLVQEAVRNNQWHEALRHNHEVDEKWRKEQVKWSPFIHNHDLDVVVGHLARLKNYLETEEKGDALAEISMIKIQTVQLHDQEVLTLHNVL